MDMTIQLILIVVVVLVLLWLVFGYNSFARMSHRAKEAWADIEVQLKRRYDLIPNLVNTVKGYASHESGTLEKVTAARTAAMQGGSLADKAQAENMLSGALKSIFALSEAYPDLKANQNFLQLQKELGDTEDKIQAARRFYNGVVRDLNTATDVVPSNLIASWFHFAKLDYFDIDDKGPESQPVEVKF